MHRASMQTGLSSAAGRWGDSVGRRVVNAAKMNCPVDEGRLRSSISHQVTVRPHSASVRIGSPLAYARYRHEGTGLYGPKHHKIVPVTAKALKFRAGRMIGPLPKGKKHPAKGKRDWVFAASVKGTPGSPFLTDGLIDVFGPGVHINPIQL